MTETKAYHHGDLRNALIALGLRVLAEEGRHGLSLRKVARLAGVSHNAPYMHFADKDALLAAIAEQGFAQLQSGMRAAIERTPRGSAEQLLRLCEAYVAFALGHPHSLGVMFADFDTGASAALGEAAQATFALLAGAIAAGQDEGLVRPGDPKVLATGVWAMMHGLSTLLIARRLTHALKASGSQADLVPVLIDVLYGGLRADRAPTSIA